MYQNKIPLLFSDFPSPDSFQQPLHSFPDTDDLGVELVAKHGCIGFSRLVTKSLGAVTHLYEALM